MRSVFPSLVVLALVACADTPVSDATDPLLAQPAPLEGEAVEPTRQDPPRGFSWVEHDVGAMAWPGAGQQLKDNARWLNEQGVDLVITLTEAELDPDIIKAYGLHTLHIPVVDFTPPTLPQIQQFVGTVSSALEREQRVVVHCAGGKGRTGTMMAAWFVANGATADEAITKIRTLRPGSIETAAQEAIVRTFAESIAH